MKKITVILGKAACGKTTLAHKLAEGKEIIEEECRTVLDIENCYPDCEKSKSVIIDEGIKYIKTILLYFDNPLVYRRKPYTKNDRIYSYRPEIIMTSNILTIEDLKELPKQCFDSLEIFDFNEKVKPPLSIGVLYTDASRLQSYMDNVHDNNTYIPIKNCGVVIGRAFDSIVILPQNGKAYNQDWLDMVIATRLNM